MLDFFVARSEQEIETKQMKSRLALGGANFWFLHRYFVQANLEPGTFDFLNPYEDTEISGYQLVRLEYELNEALETLRAKPAVFLSTSLNQCHA